MKMIIAAASLFALPVFAFAQGAPTLGNVVTLVNSIRGIVNTLIPLVFAVALLVFFWGVVRFLMNAGDEGAKESGRRLMIWGLIALFVIASVWGIVSFIGGALGINQGEQLNQVPGVGDTSAGG